MGLSGSRGRELEALPDLGINKRMINCLFHRFTFYACMLFPTDPGHNPPPVALFALASKCLSTVRATADCVEEQIGQE